MQRPRIGFVCIGNACRSQMAEGFAHVYANNQYDIHSAGLSPAIVVPKLTVETMAEKGIDLREAFPKALRAYPRDYFDLIVNMSGEPITDRANVRDWEVTDPIGKNAAVYRRVRNRVEALVSQLFEELRNAPLRPRV